MKQIIGILLMSFACHNVFAQSVVCQDSNLGFSFTDTQGVFTPGNVNPLWSLEQYTLNDPMIYIPNVITNRQQQPPPVTGTYKLFGIAATVGGSSTMVAYGTFILPAAYGLHYVVGLIRDFGNGSVTASVDLLESNVLTPAPIATSNYMPCPTCGGGAATSQYRKVAETLTRINSIHLDVGKAPRWIRRL